MTSPRASGARTRIVLERSDIALAAHAVGAPDLLCAVSYEAIVVDVLMPGHERAPAGGFARDRQFRDRFGIPFP